MITSMTASVDFENNTEEFWHEFRSKIDEMDQDSELLQNCRTLLRDNQVELTHSLAIVQFEDFVTGINGWNVDDDHAKHPIIMTVN